MAYTLLLADDSITMQRVIELTFSEKDVQVVSVSDGEEAIARIPAARPDIVLADIGMPGRDGYEVAAFVRSQPDLAHIPVLLLAGAFEPVDESRARAVRCDGVLVKPFEPQQVVARVRELLEGMAVRTAGPAASSRAVDLLADRSRREDVRPERNPDDLAVAHEHGSAGSDAPGPGNIEASASVERANDTTHRESDGSANSRPAVSDDTLDDYVEKLNGTYGAAAPASTRDQVSPSHQPDAVSWDDAVEEGIPLADDVLRGAHRDGLEQGGIAGDRVGKTTVDESSAWHDAHVTTAVPPGDLPDGPTLMPANHAAAHSIQSADGDTRGPIAEAFSVLLSVEQPDSSERPRPVQADFLLREQLVDEVTQRVLERVTPAPTREVVSQIVSEVAERLVREEIARIRGQQRSDP